MLGFLLVLAVTTDVRGDPHTTEKPTRLPQRHLKSWMVICVQSEKLYMYM